MAMCMVYVHKGIGLQAGDGLSVLERGVVQGPQDIVTLLSLTPQEIMEKTHRYCNAASQELAALLMIPHEQRTFANTIQAFDVLVGRSPLALLSHIVSSLEHVHPDGALREAARDAKRMIQGFYVDNISTNADLYMACKLYAEGNCLREGLSSDQLRFVKDLIEDFRKAGLDLPYEERSLIAQLRKDIASLGIEFAKNIADDDRALIVTRDALVGLSDKFIEALVHTDSGGYRVGVDAPTYMTVMENCASESTRKALYLEFVNRGYPANEVVLNDIFEKRHELAVRLGFPTFAHLNIDECMAKSPEVVEAFLRDILEKAHIKEQKELEMLLEELPPSVELSGDGKIKPWDVLYVYATYKKRHLSLDEQSIAEYFPHEHTMRGLFSIYETFLKLRFQEVSLKGLWHDEVRCIAIYDGVTQVLLGYVLLDLHPRPQKFNHACAGPIIPAMILPDGTKPPAVCLVIANFARGSETEQALWHREQAVRTLFHEFGHALHAILGRTPLVATTGFNVKMDFVELPSQMLEYWLFDSAILKKISKHFQTGESLPETIIEKINTVARFNSGYFVKRQISLSLLSLMCHQNTGKTPYELVKDIHRLTGSNIAYEPNNHFYAAFGHLTEYAACYYSYLWAEVFACDVFSEIERHGLLNPEVGAQYVEHILSKGGSKDPHELLHNFLKRAPNNRAFLERLGFIS